jgi:hypothetical protein
MSLWAGPYSKRNNDCIGCGIMDENMVLGNTGTQEKRSIEQEFQAYITAPLSKKSGFGR